MGTVSRLPSGGLAIPSHVTRTGVFPYKLGDGTTRRELRLPEEVFAPASLATLAHATVTDLHPEGAVNSDNWKALSVGHVASEGVQDGDHVAASLIISDANAINAIDRGERKDLSCGYTLDVLEPTAGVYQGEPFDAIQRGITYNHVAILPPGQGRAGPSVTMHLDSSDAIQLHKDTATMKTIRIDGKDYEIGSEAHIAKLAEMAAKELADAKAATAAATKRADDATALAATEKKRADAASDPKAAHKRAAERASLLIKAHSVLTKDRYDAVTAGEDGGSSSQAIMVEMIKTLDPEFNPEGKSDEAIAFYFAGLFKGSQGAPAAELDAAEEPAPPAQSNALPGPGLAHDSVSRVRGRIDGGARADVAERDRNDPDKAKDRMRKDSAEAWRQPLAMSKDRA